MRRRADRRGNSKPNVKRRGSTYTYYVYVTDADGRRRQHSKGGFSTQRDAEDARIEAASALATGSYVKAERISLADFLADEWLPFRRPPVLEESTWHSYDRYLRLHVIPHIGAVPLQKLTPVDLNQLYRQLLETGRRPVSGPGGRRPPSATRAIELRATGLTYEQIADQLRDEFEDEAAITKNAVAALLRRAADAARDSPTGPPAWRREPCATSTRSSTPRSRTRFDGTGSCATSPTPPLPRRRPPLARIDPRRGRPSSCEPSSTTPPTASTCRRGSSSPRAAADAASASVSAGPTSTSTRRRRSSPVR